jgi:HSP20 family protein
MSMTMDPFAPWMREINRLFGGSGGQGGPTAFLPPADLIVTDQGIEVVMDVPGVRTENIDVELENDVLTIRGERPFPYADNVQAVRRIERGFGRFERAMRIPTGSQVSDIQAELRDGVLTLRVPRPAERRAQRIQISAGEGEGDGATQGDTQAAQGSASAPQGSERVQA